MFANESTTPRHAMPTVYRFMMPRRSRHAYAVAERFCRQSADADAKHHAKEQERRHASRCDAVIDAHDAITFAANNVRLLIREPTDIFAIDSADVDYLSY